MYSVGCHGNILIISDGSILHVGWKGSNPLVSVNIKNTSRTSPRQPSSFVTLLCRPVSDNELPTPRRHTNNRDGSRDFPRLAALRD